MDTRDLRENKQFNLSNFLLVHKHLTCVKTRKTDIYGLLDNKVFIKTLSILADV